MNRPGTAVVLVISVVLVGAGVGAATVSLDWLVIEVVLFHVRALPLAAVAAAPVIGLVITAAILRWSVPGASPNASDDLLRAVSGRRALDPVPAPGRAAAIVATVGSGLAMGLEAPVAYLGGAIGSAVARFVARVRLDGELLMVAGAAAGVGALLRQPVLGALFVVEAPYRVGLDLRRLPVALLGAVSGFVVFDAIYDRPSTFLVTGLHLDTRLLAAAVVAGAVGSVLARVLAALVRQAKDLSASLVLGVRLAVCAVALPLIFVVANRVGVDGLTLGPGGAAVGWALSPRTEVVALGVIIALRLMATSVAVLGGGAGGLFIPLLAIGALGARLVAVPLAPTQTVAVAALGGAAAIAVGYRIPLTGLAFAIAALGEVAGVVPAVVAVGVAMALSHGVSVTSAQVPQPSMVSVRLPRRRSAAFADDEDFDDPEDFDDSEELDDEPDSRFDRNARSSWEDPD